MNSVGELSALTIGLLMAPHLVLLILNRFLLDASLTEEPKRLRGRKGLVDANQQPCTDPDGTPWED